MRCYRTVSSVGPLCNSGLSASHLRDVISTLSVERPCVFPEGGDGLPCWRETGAFRCCMTKSKKPWHGVSYDMPGLQDSLCRKRGNQDVTRDGSARQSGFRRGTGMRRGRRDSHPPRVAESGWDWTAGTTRLFHPL